MVALPADSVVAPLFGRYRILRRIGTGRAAVVFLALDLETDRRVALKLITSRRLAAPGALARLAEAARAWSAVRDRGVVGVLDHGPAAPETLPGVAARYYLALEYVRGRSLAWHAQTRGPLPIAWSVRVVRDVLAALGAIHAAGLVHLDLRPENVLVGADGSIRLTDPLLAAVLGYSKPDYLSPEQARRETPGPASDVYSAGALLYDLLADGPPFRGGSARSLLARHAAEAPVSPRARRPAVPEDLARTSLRALAKSPGDRFQSAAEFSSVLAASPWATSGPTDRSWTSQTLTVPGDRDAAPNPRQLAPQPRIRIDWRRLGQSAAIATFLVLALALGTGWQLIPSPLTLEAEEVVRISQPTPTRTPVPTPGPPVVIVYEPLFATPSAATPTPSPTPTPTFLSTAPAMPAAAPTGTPGPRLPCVAPAHTNPAIAEAYETLVAYSCGTPVEQMVLDAIAVAVERGTDIRFEQPTSAAWGYFDPGENRITLAPSAAIEPAETRAALLLHELTHTRDHFRGGMMRGSGLLACYDVELRAFRAQADFWRIVRASGSAVRSPLADDLDSIAQQIQKDASEFVMRDLVARYGAVCAPQ